MPLVGRRVGDVRVEGALHALGREDGVVAVLDVAAELVLVPGEEFRVAGDGEVEDLGEDSCDALFSALEGQAGGLRRWSVLCWKRRRWGVRTHEVAAGAAAADDDLVGVDAELGCVLLALRSC